MSDKEIVVIFTRWLFGFTLGYAAPTTAKLMAISAAQKLTELQPLLGKALVDDLTGAVTAFLQAAKL
ncbi:hypothetical protein [Agrobacterium fabrum]|uniref:hypothetical protein n=1 Tax=Agrobacterium fabrum TaxID=1176649 RepID=UPI003B9F1AF4